MGIMATNDKRRKTAVEAHYPQTTTASQKSRLCLKVNAQATRSQHCYKSTLSVIQPHNKIYHANLVNLKTLADNEAIAFTKGIAVGRCQENNINTYKVLSSTRDLHHKKAQQIGYCRVWHYKESFNFQRRKPFSYEEAQQKGGCITAFFKKAKTNAHCFKNQSKKAMAVPSEFYPIALPSAPPRNLVCPLPPPSRSLSLALVRTRAQSPRSLPLPLRCWNKLNPYADNRQTANTETFYISPKEAYIMNHNIKATINNKPIELLGFEIRADMDGFCFQVQAEVPVNEKEKTITSIGEEPILTININGEKFSFLIEGRRDNRQFISDTLTLIGRSQSAHLSADYAEFKSGSNPEIYARQIGDEILQFTGFRTQWQMANWLIPEEVYSYSGKSPIAILQEIANVAGGFLSSDSHEKMLILKRKWPFPAWEIEAQEANVSLPSSAILSISGEETLTTRANVVYAMGEENSGKAACIYRGMEARDKPCSSLRHALYTDLDVLREAGINALSETGKHKIETVTTLYNYNEDPNKRIPRAELGDIWEIEERGEKWKGVVIAVSISATSDRGAPVLTQQITIDRYLDK